MITGRAKHDPSTAPKGALKPKGRQKYHTPMPRDELPGFLRGLTAYDGDPRTALALRLIVLTVVRTGEPIPVLDRRQATAFAEVANA